MKAKESNINLLKYQFYSTVVADIFKAIDGGSYGGAFVLSFCCIDYLAEQGVAQELRGNNRINYKAFIINYMKRVNPKYESLENELYAIRCSLVHSYGESEATRKINVVPEFLYGDLFGDHLKLDNKHKLHISLSGLVSELVSAIELFFRQLKTESNSASDWFRKLYYPHGLEAFTHGKSIKMGNPINYKSIHPILEILTTEKDVNKICDFINNKLEEKLT